MKSRPEIWKQDVHIREEMIKDCSRTEEVGEGEKNYSR